MSSRNTHEILLKASCQFYETVDIEANVVAYRVVIMMQIFVHFKAVDLLIITVPLR